MALQFLDKAKIGSYLTAMWQKDLKTDEDPANGEWYEKKPNGKTGGLYGGLTDNAETKLEFDEASQKYFPELAVRDTATLDNRNGLAPHAKARLVYQYTNSATTTHSTSNSVKVGIGLEITAKATIPIIGAGGEVKTTFNFDYTHEWGDTQSKTESKTLVFSQSVEIDVPTGKVYQAVLEALGQKLIVPYTATIKVTGMTETWFEDRIDGRYNYKMLARDAFEKIRKWKLAGSESSSFSRKGFSQKGTVSAEQTTHFVAKIYDVTEAYEKEKTHSATERVIIDEGGKASTVLEGNLVMTIPFPDPAESKTATA